MEATEVQKAEFRKAFSNFDKNGDGQISSSELSSVMKNLSMTMTDQQVQDMLREVDSDNSGSIDFEEFSVYMLKKLNRRVDPNELRRRAFNACDRDGSGLIGADEFVEIMSLLGDNTITKTQAQDLIKKYDKDGNSQIGFDEFLAILSSK